MIDIFHQRYINEKTFKYDKFINLENEKYKNHTKLGDINLIIQTYPIINPKKLEEMLLCLHNNLNNKCIKKIYNIYEDNIDFLPEFIKNNSKLINIKIQKNEQEYVFTHIPNFDKCFLYIKKGYQHSNINEYTDKSIFKNNLKERLTWNFFINFCIKTFQNNEIICVANSDILIEDSFEWYNLSEYLDDNRSLCLSRHEIDKQGNVFLDFWAFKCWSADCWVFKKSDKINTLLSNYDFSIGNCMSCDNIIAGIFLKSKYLPLNNAFKYRIFHLDRITKIFENEVVLTKNHDNRLIENISNLFYAKPCPFLNYDELLLLPYDNIEQILNNYQSCENCFYHTH